MSEVIGFPGARYQLGKPKEDVGAIPQDVKRAAADLNRTLSDLRDSDGCWNFENFECAIARAIMAERERCAVLAEGKDRNVMWTPQEIAAAIRRGN